MGVAEAAAAQEERAGDHAAAARAGGGSCWCLGRPLVQQRAFKRLTGPALGWAGCATALARAQIPIDLNRNGTYISSTVYICCLVQYVRTVIYVWHLSAVAQHKQRIYVA